MRKAINFILRYHGLSRALQKAYVGVSKHLYLMPPLNFVLNLTYSCNWRCRMCFHYSETAGSLVKEAIRQRRSDELTLEEFRRVLDEMKELGVRSVPLHGGEPLLSRHFIDVARHGASLGLRLSVVSNFSFWREETMAAVVDCLSEAVVSVHGPAAVHDRVVGVPGSFEKTTANLERLGEKRRRSPGSRLRLGATFILSALNQDSLVETIESIRDLPVEYLNFGLTTYTTPAMEREVLELKGGEEPENAFGCSRLPGEILEVDGGTVFRQMQEIKKMLPGLPFKVNYLDRFDSAEQWERYFHDPHFKRAHSECLYPWLSGVATNYGEVYPCIQLSFLGWKVGDVRSQSLREIWYGPEYRRFRKVFRDNDMFTLCHKCCTTD